MKNSKKICAIALLALVSVGYIQKISFHTKIARATGGGNIDCRCSSTGGNQTCAANNAGIQCAYGENIICSDYVVNCEY